MSNVSPDRRAAPLPQIRTLLREAARPDHAAVLQRFFKTGPGEYGEGDLFLGLRVPFLRRLARQSDGLRLTDATALLRSRYHEERLLALLILVRRFERGDARLQERVFRLYLRGRRFVNNWDLVDLSAPNILGTWLLPRPRTLLRRLAGSRVLWDRRMAVLATLTFIRHGQFEDTLDLCRRLLRDEEDLLHKACGWMLREIGKRDRRALNEFLERQAGRMPRTMLRYAIERLPERERRAWLRRPGRSQA
jgi:3-methyladenine DNA glycosylase AlkD